MANEAAYLALVMDTYISIERVNKPAIPIVREAAVL